jgi:acyl-CoA thioesterase-1
MPLPPQGRLPRRALLAGALTLIAPAARAVQADGARVVTMLGDSLTAGYGLPAADAIPARLQEELARRGLNVIVRPAGVSGDTSADALARVDFSVKPDTDLCIVALGGNDLLQGIDPKVTGANLLAILDRLKARRIPALLAGVKAPQAMGASYASDMQAMFAATAKARGAVLYPNLVDGVEFVSALNQADGIHPNARGARIVAARLAPVVAQALRSSSRSKPAR